ncbi:LPS assembly lipoprotein LptE [Reichenbachiella agarivorans]|uniref:LPS assembly lipoprotein LptE n=1 Tax=Reichenbachiella agarivorans TaxID=2979464 RepID=A0ABY6CMR4_9BACT|nr:LptE family protein [Reichenbachiella agarivorans]UXP31802.1 LPS assembly lipoprotein LptE [Reichenbachiella agarivorans]
MNWKSSLLIILLACCMSTSCGVYSFTGASISADVKTISIPTFYNNAPLGPSNMSITFTEQIRDYFIQNTNLRLVDSDGDLQLEGAVTNYTLSPVAVTAAQEENSIDLTSLTRLTIYVNASYVNIKDDTYDFDKTFSFFIDFDQDRENLSSNEEQFVEEIFDQIILDIFNSSVANW